MSFYPDYIKWQDLEVETELEELKKKINFISNKEHVVDDLDLNCILKELNQLIGLKQLKEEINNLVAFFNERK